MIYRLSLSEFDAMLAVFNDAYPAYKDASVPADNMTLNVTSAMFVDMLRIAFSSVSNSEADTKVVMITSAWKRLSHLRTSTCIGPKAS